jgi:threonine dehydrogenase-like Zn-dependent dehydrogenase
MIFSSNTNDLFLLGKEYFMNDKLSDYKQGKQSYPNSYRLWPLSGAGFESLGVAGKPVEVPFPEIGPDDLLIRHDACGLCFSDIKVIAQGQSHPRIFRDMQKEPVVLGHEVTMTVIGVGDNLRDRYHVGDRLTLETDIVTHGKTLAYGYWFQGGLSQYSSIGPDIYDSDLGNNLITLRPDIGYAESALTEPWACVIAAYRLKYRTGLKPGGTTWIIGTGDSRPFTISEGFSDITHPGRLLLTNVPTDFRAWLTERADQYGVDIIDVPETSNLPLESVDDIVMLGANPDLIEQVSPKLGQFGIMAIMTNQPMPRKVMIDVGRIHYSRWVYVGTVKEDIADAYQRIPVRSSLEIGGSAWFVGAGGPMGRMHVQRAVQFEGNPSIMICSDVSSLRLGELCNSFEDEARAKGIDWLCLNPNEKDKYTKVMTPYFEKGFDDIIMLVAVPSVIADAYQHLAVGGVMNVFAGVARGTMVSLDLSDVYLKDVRVIGHSASQMSDMQMVLSKLDAGQLSPNRSVAAIGSLNAAKDGLLAVKNTTYAGKVVIYPNIKEMPLTLLDELKDKMPSVYALLDNGEWTNKAEEEFLKIMLP